MRFLFLFSKSCSYSTEPQIHIRFQQFESGLIVTYHLLLMRVLYVVIVLMLIILLFEGEANRTDDPNHWDWCRATTTNCTLHTQQKAEADGWISGEHVRACLSDQWKTCRKNAEIWLQTDQPIWSLVSSQSNKFWWIGHCTVYFFIIVSMLNLELFLL